MTGVSAVVERPDARRGVVQVRVTLEARKPLAGAALARSSVTRKQHFLNHALLLDEPTSALDIAHQLHVLKLAAHRDPPAGLDHDHGAA
jgi:ABC-type dipeptide/oligopeptide/nickel transport system ATPase subunit